MGRIFLELGQHGDASRAFTIARARKDRLPYVEYYFGLSESRAGRAQSAIEAFRSAIRDNPDSFQSHRALGQELIDNSRFEDAVAPLKRAVMLDPRDVEAKAALGLAFFESAQYPEGIKMLEEADRMKPGNEIIAMFLRVARARQESVPRIDEIKLYAKENPKHLAVRINLIETLAYARRIGEAEPYLQEALALKPKEIRDYLRIAVAYGTAGDRERALSILRKSFELGESPGAYMNLADIYAHLGKADEASAAYAKAIELKPDAAQTMKLYADHLRDNGKRREALEMYRRSLSIIPTNGPSLASAAILSAKLDEMDSAKTYLATLKTVDPELAAKVESVLVLLRYLK
jgi:tetratricopeptide (TPR) repeat protein